MPTLEVPPHQSAEHVHAAARPGLLLRCDHCLRGENAEGPSCGIVRLQHLLRFDPHQLQCGEGADHCDARLQVRGYQEFTGFHVQGRD